MNHATVTMSWDALNATLSHILRTADGDLPLIQEITAALRAAQPAVDITDPLYAIPDDVAEAILALTRYLPFDDQRDIMGVRILTALYLPVYPRKPTPVIR